MSFISEDPIAARHNWVWWWWQENWWLRETHGVALVKDRCGWRWGGDLKWASGMVVQIWRVRARACKNQWASGRRWSKDGTWRLGKKACRFSVVETRAGGRNSRSETTPVEKRKVGRYECWSARHASEDDMARSVCVFEQYINRADCR